MPRPGRRLPSAVRPRGARVCFPAPPRHARRDFVGIPCSSADRVRGFRFPAGIIRILDFAEAFLGGGTSCQTPLATAGELLEKEFDATARPRADIVMITDDECGVTEQWTRDRNDAGHLPGFRVFGLAAFAPRAAEADSVLDAPLRQPPLRRGPHRRARRRPLPRALAPARPGGGVEREALCRVAHGALCAGRGLCGGACLSYASTCHYCHHALVYGKSGVMPVRPSPL